MAPGDGEGDFCRDVVNQADATSRNKSRTGPALVMGPVGKGDIGTQGGDMTTQRIPGCAIQ